MRKPSSPLSFMTYVIGIALLMISSINSSNSYADDAPSTQTALEDQALLTTKQWVIVLDDPRPARLQGWQRGNYSGSYKGNQQYTGSLELERFGNSIAQRYDLELKQQWFIESLAVYCLIVEFNGQTSTTLKQLKQDEQVQWIQPSNDFKLLSSSSDKPLSSTEQNQNLSQQNSSNSKGGSLSSIPESINGQGVVIAIIDSAVDEEHRDLSHAVRQRADFVISEKTDIKDAALQGEAHGTAVAGVMIAQRDSKLGLPGVAPAASLMALRGCWEENSGNTRCNTLSLARALDAVVSSEPAILNLSLSGPRDPLLDRLINKIVKNKTLVVAAFDPARPHEQRFPSRGDGVLIVRAEMLDKQYQNEFTAPGARVVTSPGNRYNFMTGHSIATAYTSGVLALLTQLDKLDKGQTQRKLPELLLQSNNPPFQSIMDLIHSYWQENQSSQLSQSL